MNMGCEMDSGNDFSIILPTYNEAGNIAPMIESLSILYPNAEIIVMDDNSTDGTPEKAKCRHPPGGGVRVVVRQPEDKGLTASIMDGILLAKTPFFVVLDADFQHPPESISSLVKCLREGSDISVGVRGDKMSMLFYRKFASCGAHLMASTYLKAKGQPQTSDTMSGFFGGRTALVQDVIRKDGNKFERGGFKVLFDILRFAPKDTKIGEATFRFDGRRSGESKLDYKIVISIMRQCGIVGKFAASASIFFLMTTLGRCVAAILLGLLSTLAVILLTGEAGKAIFYNSFLSVALAIVFMLVANELIMRFTKRDVIIRGISVLAITFLCYLLNLSLFYALSEDLPAITIISTFLGLMVALSYDSVGLGILKPSPE